MFEQDEMEEFKSPSRKPVIVVLVLVLVAGGGFFLVRARSGRKPDQPRGATAVTTTTIGAVPPTTIGVVPVSNAVQRPPPPTVQPRDVGELLRQAREMESGGKLEAARDQYVEALRSSTNSAQSAVLEENIGRLNMAMLFSRAKMKEKVTHVVKTGDSIDVIARKYGTTPDLIEKANGLKNRNVIHQGDVLIVFTGRFSIAVSKSKNELVLNMNDNFFKRYKVGTGRHGSTPVGTFAVRDRVVEPDWDHPDGRHIAYGDPENILGTRWMAIKATGDTADVKGYGIHGTADPGSIGKAESAGCVRMLNSDVEELFTLTPLGTPVTIRE